MLILQGFSEERSAYSRVTNFLRLYGWVLSPEIDAIHIYSDSNKIAEAQTNILNKTLWEAFDKRGNKNCSWKFEGEVNKEFNPENITLYFYRGNKLLLTVPVSINFDIEQDKYLSKFKTMQNEIRPKGKKVANEEDILIEFNKNNINIKTFNFEYQKYIKWFNIVNYKDYYPEYHSVHKEHDLHTKAMQHYISVELLELNKDDIYMDVASSHSVCPDIIKRLYTQKIFRQDLTYKEGVYEDRIGSNADNIPLKENSVSKIGLHCSWEHFENDADINFLNEAHRILSMNGKIVITPLYLSKNEHISTSPTVWASKYSSINNYPKFTKNYKLVLEEVQKQRYYKRFSVKSLINEVLEPFKNKFKFEIYYLEDPKNDLLYYPTFTLVCTKI